MGPQGTSMTAPDAVAALAAALEGSTGVAAHRVGRVSDKLGDAAFEREVRQIHRDQADSVLAALAAAGYRIVGEGGLVDDRCWSCDLQRGHDGPHAQMTNAVPALMQLRASLPAPPPALISSEELAAMTVAERTAYVHDRADIARSRLPAPQLWRRHGRYGAFDHDPDTADVAYECEDLGEGCKMHQPGQFKPGWTPLPAPPPALDVERLARALHEEAMAYGMECRHKNQHHRSWDCWEHADRLAAYEREGSAAADAEGQG